MTSEEIEETIDYILNEVLLSSAVTGTLHSRHGYSMGKISLVNI